MNDASNFSCSALFVPLALLALAALGTAFIFVTHWALGDPTDKQRSS